MKKIVIVGGMGTIMMKRIMKDKNVNSLEELIASITHEADSTQSSPFLSLYSDISRPSSDRI